MSYHGLLTTVLAFTTGIAALVVTVVVLARSREGTQATAWILAGLSGTAGLWALALGLRVTAMSPADARFWLRAGYVVSVPLPTLGLVFALHQTRSLPVGRQPLALLAVEPLVAGLLAATNSAHGLYLDSTRMVTVGTAMTVGAVPGIGFLLHGGYCVLAGAAFVGLFVREIRRRPGPQRQLGLMLAGGATPPTVSIALFLTNSPLVPAFDTTPIWLAALSVVVLAAVRGYGLFDVSPVAHRAVFREVDDPIVVVDDEFRVIETNPAAESVFDAERGTMLGSILPSGFPPEEIVACEDRTVVTFPDERAEYEATVTDLTTDEQACVLTFRDVTDRRRVERRFRTYVEQSNDVLLVVDRDGEIDYASDAARRTFGHEPAQLAGRSVLGLIHPDDRETVTAAFQEAVEAHQAADGSCDVTMDDEGLAGSDRPTVDPRRRDESERRRFRVVTDDGGWRTAEAVVAVGQGVAGERLLINLRDVTEQQRYEQRLRVLNRVLRHDLRNDANVVAGYADLLLNEELSPAAHERVTAIRRKANRLVELGEQARAVDRTLHAASDETHPVGLADVIDCVGTRAEETYPESTVETVCPSDVYVEANDLLASAVRELVANGIEHNDTATPWVRVSASVGDEWVYVTVTDDGPGIPETERAVLDHGTETALEHGSGLGLWLVKWIVDAVDGNVSFAERVPRGSEVTLRLLPADPPEPGEQTPTSDPTEWIPTGGVRTTEDQRAGVSGDAASPEPPGSETANVDDDSLADDLTDT